MNVWRRIERLPQGKDVDSVAICAQKAPSFFTRGCLGFPPLPLLRFFFWDGAKRGYGCATYVGASATRHGIAEILPSSRDGLRVHCSRGRRNLSSIWSLAGYGVPDLKNILVDLDRDVSGRVPLPDFYRAMLDDMMPTSFEFVGSVGFLRQLGALNESDALRTGILVPKNVNARTNCLMTKSFYVVCRIDKCERLLGMLEREIGAPAATPARITQIVENLPSNTVETPRVHSGSLLWRLTEVAERHDGAVPLHSRQFAQWHTMLTRESASFRTSLASLLLSHPTIGIGAHVGKGSGIVRCAHGVLCQTRCVASVLSLCSPCRDPRSRGVPSCKTLGGVEIHSLSLMGEGLVQVCVNSARVQTLNSVLCRVFDSFTHVRRARNLVVLGDTFPGVSLSSVFLKSIARSSRLSECVAFGGDVFELSALRLDVTCSSSVRCRWGYVSELIALRLEVTCPSSVRCRWRWGVRAQCVAVGSNVSELSALPLGVTCPSTASCRRRWRFRAQCVAYGYNVSE